MSTKKQKTFNVKINIDSNKFQITDDKFNILVNLNRDQIQSINNLISCMIDEDIPAMIKNGNWNKENYKININCELPLENMVKEDN